MYLYSIPYNEKYIVYRPLLKLAFVANSIMVNLIAKWVASPKNIDMAKTRDAYLFLEKIGFLKPDPDPPVSSSGFLSNYEPDTAVLCLTTSCNFRCVYCYASGGEKQYMELSFEKGVKAIDLVCNNAEKNKKDYFLLGFHGGGEPTINGQRIKKFIDYAGNKRYPSRITVATNGYWSDDKREWMLKHTDEISLSLDGIESVQNSQRPLSSGKGTFRNVFKTVRTMDEKGFPYGIRMTVIDENIKYLAQSIEFLCRNTSCPTFQVEPAFNHGRAASLNKAMTHYQQFTDEFIRAHRYAVEYGRHLYYSGARPWLITDRFCKAPEKAVVVTPDAGLTACYEVSSRDHLLNEDFFFGNIGNNGNIEIDNLARERLEKKIVARRKLCKDCFCYWHCAGDCPAKTFSKEPDGHLRFNKRCDLNREITKALIIEKIAAGNGVWTENI